MKINLLGKNMMIETREAIYFICIEDILYIEKVDQKLQIHTQDECIDIRSTLKDMESLLPKEFIRVHRSFLVNVKKIKEVIKSTNSTFEIYYSEEKYALMNKNVMSDIYDLKSKIS